ncbi:MAG: hypothetical protein WBG11_15580 [Methylocella sp.]
MSGTAQKPPMDREMQTAADYTELRKLLDARRRELGMTMCELDYVSGVQEGYSAKLFCGMRNLGWLSTGLILQALRVKIALVKEEEEGLPSM